MFFEPESTPSNRPNKVLILGALYGTGNMGVDALLSGTLASLFNSNCKVDPVLLEFSHQPRVFEVPVAGGVVQVRLENLRFSWRLWLRNNGFRLLALTLILRLFPVPAFRRWCLARHPALATIDSASMAVSLAGGDSFSDIYGFQRLLYVCLPQFLVLAMRCPLALFPQTLGPFKAWWARWMGRFVMHHAQRVFSRDQSSLSIARKLLGTGAAHLDISADMAFALEPRCPEGGIPDWASMRERPLVGLNVSGLLYMGGYTRNNMFGLQVDYPALTREIIQWFTKEAAVDLVLVTHVTGWENDAKACAAIHAELQAECEGRLHLADPEYDHREVKYLIGQCDFFLGARMHACIAALSQGVPAVGLAYSRKFAGVFESVGVPDLVMDLRNLDNKQILNGIQRAYADRAGFVEKLERSVPAAKVAALTLFSRACESQGETTVASIVKQNRRVESVAGQARQS